MLTNIKVSDGSRDEVLEYVRKRKAEGTFRVIDVGGTVGGWSAPIVDAIVDINDPGSEKIEWFKVDINDPEGWIPLEDHVRSNGKYDFCICSHTLEDIVCPAFVSRKLSSIAKAGFVAVPSKFVEMTRGVDGPYRGYVHHRWVFDVKNDECVGYPKLNFLEHLVDADNMADDDPNRKDLSFWWTTKVPLRIINDDYMGPTVQAVYDMYKPLFT